VRRQNAINHPRRTAVVVDSLVVLCGPHAPMFRATARSRASRRFALLDPLDYDSRLHNTPTGSLSCDGCGQAASPEHFARRLQRLEWTTRYRPIHMTVLLLGGVSPLAEEDFLYSGKFKGDACRVLDAVGISAEGKSSEQVLSEFQRSGFFLTHVLECPLESGQAEASACELLLKQRLSAVVTRIRRSLKPKRVVLISELLTPLVARLSSAELGCSLVLDEGKPFGLESSDISGTVSHLRHALGLSAVGM
jgi:hypothetical protein